MTRHRTYLCVLILIVLGVALSGFFFHLDEQYLRAIDTQNPPSHLTAGPQRIICMSPAITELVFALECGSHVIGVSDFCTYPPAAQTKIRVGGTFNPNLERLRSLNPDVIITQGRFEKMVHFCQKNNIGLIQLEVSNLAAIFGDLNRLGHRLGCPTRAQRLIKEIQQSLTEVKNHLKKYQPRRIFFSLGRTSGSLTQLSTVGGNTFISELIEIAAGRNIFADLNESYPHISKETLLKRTPDVIIEACPGQTLSPEQQKQMTADWLPLAYLPAVRDGNIHFLTEDYLLIPAVRIGQIALRLAQCIHPEAFRE